MATAKMSMLSATTTCTEAMQRDARLSFKSYDRFFPNQDTLPKGGLGNLVALPLQGNARRNGNSVFVDENNGAKPFVKDYGMVIVDECHHVSSVTFEQVLRQVTARYVYGLTATPIRKDGHQPIIFMQCGKIRYTADATSQIGSQSFERVLIPRFTTYRNINPNDKETFAQTIQKLAGDENRNALIVNDIKNALQEKHTPIVLTTLTSHVRRLAQMLESEDCHVVALVGADSEKDKRLAMERLLSIPRAEPMVVVDTGKYIGEGEEDAVETPLTSSPR